MKEAKFFLLASFSLSVLFIFSCGEYAEIPYERRLSEGGVPPPVGTATLISDFENGKNVSYLPGESWWISPEKATVGNTTCSGLNCYVVTVTEGGNSFGAIQNYNLPSGANIALGLTVEQNQIKYDLTKCSGGFRYRYRGVAHRFQLCHHGDGFNGFQKVIPVSSGWTTVTIALSELKQGDGWGNIVPFDMTNMRAFEWSLVSPVSPSTGSLAIDDFYCMGTMPIGGN